MEVLSRQTLETSKATVSFLILVLAVTAAANPGVSHGAQSPQEKVDLNVVNRIKDEA